MTSPAPAALTSDDQKLLEVALMASTEKLYEFGQTAALVELLAALWQERRAIQDMANDPNISDADLRSFCRAIALPPTREDMEWAMKQMGGAR